MSRPAEELLEFDRLKELVGGASTCALGRRAILALAPRQDAPALEVEFALVAEAMACQRAGGDLGFGSLDDPEPWLARLAVPASVLAPAELLSAASLVESAGAVRQLFRNGPAAHPRLGERAALPDLRVLAATVRRSILPNGEISDEASPQLRRIRAGRAAARENIRRAIESILRARGEPAGEDYITLRHDRFVIPVRSSDRRSVPGVVHGASATGQTLFTEPIETVDLNNRLVQFAEEEAAEIARILSELTERLRAERSLLVAQAEGIAHFDSLFARARFAREYDCTIPQFTPEIRLRLAAARNPVLEAALRPRGRAAIPLSLELGGDKGSPGSIMVISGPNTGGKTVALKTAGLAALSAQSGIPVAAERAELPLFDRVLADIGDEQSIAADLSTFSARLLNLKAMLEIATERSLILLDEIGAGTAPEEGSAIAVALLEEFRERRSLTLATTHHDRLKAYAATAPGVLNAAMEFDHANLRPTFRLLVGVPGMSSGIEIAGRLGLPARVVDRARASLSPESREAAELIAYLHRGRAEMDEARRALGEERAQLEAERSALRSEWAERQQQRIAALEKSFRETQKRLEDEVSRLAAEVRDPARRAQLEKHAGRRWKSLAAEARADADAAVLETLAASQPDLGVSPPAPAIPLSLERLAPGQRIRVRGIRQSAVFRAHDGRVAEVEAGPLRMKVPLADITAAEDELPAPTPAAPARPRGVTVHIEPGSESAAEEINVIGCTVEEASARVDKFLDRAALAGFARVRIIHGHGTGALRRGLAAFLSAHPLVESLHAEAEDRGGAAVTVAELRG